MIDHLSIPVTSISASKTFYEAALKPLGYQPIVDSPEAVCMAAADGSSIWLVVGTPVKIHFAFAADKERVHAFYEAALSAGGTDNGAPGPRPHYTPDYYAAFVYDPDGYNVEAVAHIQI